MPCNERPAVDAESYPTAWNRVKDPVNGYGEGEAEPPGRGEAGPPGRGEAGPPGRGGTRPAELTHDSRVGDGLQFRRIEFRHVRVENILQRGELPVRVFFEHQVAVAS